MHSFVLGQRRLRCSIVKLQCAFCIQFARMIFCCFPFLSAYSQSTFTDSKTRTYGKFVHDVCAAWRKRHINAEFMGNTMPLEKASIGITNKTILLRKRLPNGACIVEGGIRNKCNVRGKKPRIFSTF